MVIRNYDNLSSTMNQPIGEGEATSNSVMVDDLYKIATGEVFHSFTAERKIDEVVERYRQSGEQFNLAAQMTELVEIAFQYEDPEEGYKGYKPRSRSERIFAAFDCILKNGTDEELREFLLSGAAQEVRGLKSRNDDKLIDVIVKRYKNRTNLEVNSRVDARKAVLANFAIGAALDDIPKYESENKVSNEPPLRYSYNIEDSHPSLDQAYSRARYGRMMDEYKVNDNDKGYPAVSTASLLGNSVDLSPYAVAYNNVWLATYGVTINDFDKIGMHEVINRVQYARLDQVKRKLRPYPEWFAAYVMESYPELGSYDDSKKIFRQRERHSAVLLPEFNEDAVEEVYDLLKKQASKYEREPIDRVHNFAELYGKAVASRTALGEEALRDTEGDWHCVDNLHDHKAIEKIEQLIDGKGTGWFPGGADGIAMFLKACRAQEVHVFTSGDNKIPRILICSSKTRKADDICYVLGLGDDRQIEPEMMGALERVDWSHFGSSVAKGFDTFKRASEMQSKLESGEELSADDIHNLWFDKFRGDDYFGKTEGSSLLDSIRYKRSFVEDVTELLHRGKNSKQLADLVLDQYLRQARHLVGAFWRHGVYLADDSRYYMKYGRDPLDEYRRRYGLDFDADCEKVFECRFAEASGEDEILEKRIFWTAEFDIFFDRLTGPFQEKYTINVPADEAEEMARLVKALPNFIKLYAEVNMPLGEFDINKVATEALNSDDTEVIKELYYNYRSLSGKGLKIEVDSIALRLCELCESVIDYPTKLLATVIAKDRRLGPDFWKKIDTDTMPLASHAKLVKDGVVDPTQTPIRG